MHEQIIIFEQGKLSQTPTFLDYSTASEAELSCTHLEKSKHPWIIWPMKTYSPCPIIGSWDFRSYSKKDSQLKVRTQFCPSERIPSRMESECMSGEGIQFIFPNKSCDFITNGKSKEIRLYNWGNWTEGDVIYFVLGSAHHAHYIMSFRDMRTLSRNATDAYSNEVMIHFYSYPVLPSEVNHVPHIQLRANKSSTGMHGICFDVDKNCKERAEKGLCSKEKFYCQLSCKSCNDRYSNFNECQFGNVDKTREWYFYRGDKKKKIIINSNGIARIDDFKQKFFCKAWNPNSGQDYPQYKVMTTFNNGCRPRYSCLEISTSITDGQLHSYRLSSSIINNYSSDVVCKKFKDDSTPLKDEIRSKERLSLFPVNDARYTPNMCSLNGTFRVAIVAYMNELVKGKSGHCTGTISDLNPSCSPTNRLRLKTEPPCLQNNFSQEIDFTCVGFTQVGKHTLLITKEDSFAAKFICWIIFRGVSDGVTIYKLKDANCGANIEKERKSFRLHFTPHAEKVTCIAKSPEAERRNEGGINSDYVNDDVEDRRYRQSYGNNAVKTSALLAYLPIFFLLLKIFI
ncbi:DgyrCDS8804 [Dimorphilus gyrociliatus]|uniref:DgyrCDS8804 n=1 Tax=Dimorphilus gyrociliatus TaxID=2664684 RepID=A0A7I8VVG8_9ANNE|nr:DgyrCDS8804 [Dimorphilus gyrociliatus]